MEATRIKIDDNYSYEDVPLGTGAFGTVYKGLSKRDKCSVAVKRLMPKIAEQWRTNKDIRREVEVLRNIEHPNVVRFFDVVERGKEVYIIMELCDAGNLRDLKNRIKAENISRGIPPVEGQGPFSQIFVFDIFCQICSGMVAVNRKGTIDNDVEYMHRDLKLDNIMLTKNNVVKIVDFGLARAIIGRDLFKLEHYSARGTPKYAATELLRHEDYNVKCDVFSLGVVLYELLTGVQLFGEARVLFVVIQNMVDLENLHVRKIAEGLQLPSNVNQFFRGILPKMIQYQDQRIDFFTIEREVLQNRLAIGRGIDPKYTFEVLSTTKKENEMDAYKPTAVQVRPMESIRVTSKATEEFAAYKRTEERFASLKTELLDFVYFLYMRGRMMVDLMEMINTHYPLHKFLKYTLSYLAVGYFKSSNREMRRYIANSTLRLPSGAEISVMSFPPEMRENLRIGIADFLEAVQKDEEEFNKLLTQLYPRLTSEQNRTDFRNIYEGYPEIYEALEDQMTRNELKSEEFFSDCYERFFKKKCLPENYRTLPEQAVRALYMALRICQPKVFLPDNEGIHQDTVKFAIESFKTIPLDRVYKYIRGTVGF